MNSPGQIPTLAFADHAVLELEFSEALPDKCDARLDLNDDPRYIIVNRNLPQYQQVFGIGREAGFYQQQRRYDSMLLNRPWKWEALAAAPDEVRHLVCQLDAEARSYLFMFFHAKRDDFVAFVKNEPKTFLRIVFSDNIIRFHLLKLRVQTWIFRLFYFLALG